MKAQTISTKKIVLTALLAALTVAGSYARITVPADITGTTSFHSGKICFALSGLLLAPQFLTYCIRCTFRNAGSPF